MIDETKRTYLFAYQVLGLEAKTWLEETKHLSSDQQEKLLWDIFEHNKYKQFCPKCKESRDYDSLQQNIIRAYMEGKLIWK